MFLLEGGHQVSLFGRETHSFNGRKRLGRGSEADIAVATVIPCECFSKVFQQGTHAAAVKRDKVPDELQPVDVCGFSLLELGHTIGQDRVQ